MLNKKDYLLNLIKYDYNSSMETMTSDTLLHCSIVGKPSKEFLNTFVNGDIFTNFLKKYNIEYNNLFFESPSVTYYFPQIDHEIDQSICYVNIALPSKNQVDLVSKYMFEEVFEYYQNKLNPTIFLKILNKHPENLTISDMFSLFPIINVAELGRKVNRKRQTLCDLKNGKSNISISVLSSFMNLYPLLPWDSFLRQYADVRK